MKPSRYSWLRDPRVIVLAVVCIAAGFAVAALIFGRPWHLPPAWGDIPTWLATIAATVAGIVAFNVYRIEAGRDQVSELERRSAQAAKVAAWYGSTSQEVMRRRGDSVQTQTVSVPVWGAFLRNASDLPVSDVAVRFLLPSSGADDSADARSLHRINKDILAPNNEPIHLEIAEVVLRTYSDDEREDAFHRVEIEFTDTQGIRWQRDVKGRLKDITASAANRA